jgi:multidrug efflux pump subunit AcrB
MWIVRLALRRPYTFIVMSMLMGVLGMLGIMRMPVDIFPVIDIPVVSAIWTFTGISPEDIARRVVTSFERSMTTSVNDIEHIESQSVQGNSIVRVYFHPDAKVDLAVAQISAASQSLLRILPPGITPPNVIKYNAASVPVLQLGISSKTFSEQQIYDYSQNFIRTQLTTVQGASMPTPYGGRIRQIMIDMNPDAMLSRGISAADLSAAIGAQNLILPAGTAKIGEREYNVRLNSSPEVVEAFGDMPVKVSGDTTIRVKDVASVRDGYMVQTNIVRHDGSRGALITILKSGPVSTLEIIERVKTQLAKIMAGLPKDLIVEQLFDQSVFVRDAIGNVLQEALIAAVLTALMILLFLGSWRSTVMVCISIPLSILASAAMLALCGQTINVMTLGGLALAVGILVDDATVELENIHRNLGQGKPIIPSILDGAQQIAVPTFVSTLSICIVFVTVVFLTGTAKYLFTPLALSVVFAMMASYLLSRTLVPTMARYMLPAEAERYRELEQGREAKGGGPIWRMHLAFHHQFEKLRDHYSHWLAWALNHRTAVISVFLMFTAASGVLLQFVGQDFFPDVDAGLLRLHVRAPAGTRVEQTEIWFAKVEHTIREIIPKKELNTILDNIGLPSISINLAFNDSATLSAADGEIMIALKQEHSRPTSEYAAMIRERLGKEYPQLTVFFQPADMTNQILNFGLPAPIDVQVSSRDDKKAYAFARQLETRIRKVPGAVDVHLHQVVFSPDIKVTVDRELAAETGLTQKDVANSVLMSLSGTSQVSPSYWLSPVNGVSYAVAVQTPQSKNSSIDELYRTPLTGSLGGATQMLGNLARFSRSYSPAVINHYNVQPVFDVYSNVYDRDLGGVSNDVHAIVDEFTPKLPPGVSITMRGQSETMRSSFTRLGFGILFAILLVYLLMVVNFQSWLDPFIILMALPGLFTGILWILFITQTSLSVPSLMGSIMAIGVATANSILLVTFANDQRKDGFSAVEAALSAGYTRLRPVLMTALAMLIGMLPISLGLGEGGEQNAPLGRAVIGGLIMATFATLFFVPVIYSVLRRKDPALVDPLENG